MATVSDVAAYILRRKGEMTAMKLQKLVYYSQAWSLVWDEAPLFSETIEAWANGPVCPALYAKHRGSFTVGSISGDPDVLTDAQRDTVDRVLAFYGDKDAHWLSELTHSERPWMDARVGSKAGERSSNPITNAAMAEYYSSL